MSALVLRDCMGKDRAATNWCRVHRPERSRCVLAVAVQSKGGSSPIVLGAAGMDDGGVDSGRSCSAAAERVGSPVEPIRLFGYMPTNLLPKPPE